MRFEYPKYKLKMEFYLGTFGENDWELGETACVDRTCYMLPNKSEYVIFKFVTRTPSGQKKVRWEEWHNGKFSNNYFGSYDESTRQIENEMAFNGFGGSRGDYRVY